VSYARVGFGQYSTDSGTGINTSGVSTGSNQTVSEDTIMNALNALPFGGSTTLPNQDLAAVQCTWPGCTAADAAGISSGAAAAPQSNTLLIVILALAAVAGMFIAGGKH
jgi:hypothetical protein